MTAPRGEELDQCRLVGLEYDFVEVGGDEVKDIRGGSQEGQGERRQRNEGT